MSELKLIADCIPPKDPQEPEMPDPAFLNALRDSLKKIELAPAKSNDQIELENSVQEDVRHGTKIEENARPSVANKEIEKRDPVNFRPQQSITEQNISNLEEEDVEAKEDDTVTSIGSFSSVCIKS